jgi:hypothetical protein
MEKKIETALDKANSTLERFGETVKNYAEGPKKVLNDVIEFLKKHKRLLIAVGLLYLLFDYLFSENTEEVEEEQV